MGATVQLLSRRLGLGAILLSVVLLGVSCGGSGDSSDGAGGGGIPADGTLPDPTGGTVPPVDTTDDGLPDSGGDDGSSDDGSGDDGSADDGTGDPVDDTDGTDGGLPVPEPVVPARSWDDFGHVVALTTNPDDGSAYAVNFENGAIFRIRVDEEVPLALGHWAPVAPLGYGPVRALAWRTGYEKLLAVVDRGDSTPDDLIEIDPVSLIGTLIGPIGTRTGVESLAWYERQAMLYGVDRDRMELIAIDIFSGNVLFSRELGEAFGRVDGLAVDEETRCFYGSNASDGVIYQYAPFMLSPADEVPEELAVPDARLMGKTSDGKMHGLAFLGRERLFYGVDFDQGRLYLSDVMGHGIHASRLHGMAFCADDGLLYASHVGNRMLVGINRESLWKHYVGPTGVAPLDGLASPEAGGHFLYGLSSATQELFRVERMDGAAVLIARVQGPGSPWTELKGLAFGDGWLYAVDANTGDVLGVDPATGIAKQLATLPAGGIQSLSYQAEGKLLHAYSDKSQLHLILRAEAPGIVVEAIPNLTPSVGGLAWDAFEGRLFGSDLLGDQVALLYETPSPASMPYENVHSIVWDPERRLLGADLGTAALFQVDADTQETAELTLLGDARIEAMAADIDGGLVYLSDTSGPYLLVMGPGLDVAYVGSPGPPTVLATAGIKAMTWDAVNRVLYGIDLNGAGGATLVTIDPATGSITAFPQPIGFENVEALAWAPIGWDPYPVRLIAVDRQLRTLIQIDVIPGGPDAGRGFPFGAELPEEIGDVRGATLSLEGLGVLEVVDAAGRRIHKIDSVTGEVVR